MARLFFAVEIVAPWPEHFPEGRLLDAGDRHMTLAFLGEADPEQVHKDYAVTIGPVGYFDSCHFFHTAVSWHAVLLTQNTAISALQQQLSGGKDTRPFVPHVTVARRPKEKKKWLEAFSLLPFIGSALHLYESLGDSRYRSLHATPFILPFEELEHTADMAFCVRAASIAELYTTAAIALSFHFSPFLQFLDKEASCSTLDEVIRQLNGMVAAADSAMGCPIKAVSYHGTVCVRPDGLLEWEMIVDV